MPDSLPDTSKTRTFNSRDFRNALGRFATGVTVLTAILDDEVRGMTCNAFMSVSLDPPLIAVSVGHEANIHDLLIASGRYGISILSSEQEHISNHFAGFEDAEVEDPFFEIDGLPLIKNCDVYIIATIVATHSAGDHTLFIGEVEHLQYVDDQTPLLFYGGQYTGIVIDDNTSDDG